MELQSKRNEEQIEMQLDVRPSEGTEKMLYGEKKWIMWVQTELADLRTSVRELSQKLQIAENSLSDLKWKKIFV